MSNWNFARYRTLVLGTALIVACIDIPGGLRDVGGPITGLAGTGLVLQLNGSHDLAVSAGATLYRFGPIITEGSTYTVTVLTHPENPSQTCTMDAATVSGRVGSSDITNVSINCVSVPPLVTGPSDQTVAIGQTATFSVTASGNHPFDYQWKRNETDIEGATSATYTTPPANQADDETEFTVTITDAYQGVTNRSASLYVRSWSSFIETGSMTSARGYGHAATLLASGKVLITGGAATNGGPSLSSAEVYDPSSGRFAATGLMTEARSWHTATLLPNGKVLIAGGVSDTGGDPSLSSAELYDPSSGTFAATDFMTRGHQLPSATLLPNGLVLVAAGFGEGTDFPTTSELYDPLSELFTDAALMNVGRTIHTATLLQNGEVLFTGGTTLDGTTLVDLSSAELYDPSAGTVGSFSSTGSMITKRHGHTATLLLNGKVLVAGGSETLDVDSVEIKSSAELFDPSSGIGAFIATGDMTTKRSDHTAVTLPNGKVLVTGGYDGANALSGAELFEPSSGIGAFTASGNMTTKRYCHTATLLPNGKVLITGGSADSSDSLSTAELFQ